MPDLSRLSLNALRAVEVVARRGSLRAAADELGVTIGAVSQQVLLAERQLGQILFERRPSGMILTDSGRQMQPLLAEGFAAIAASVQRVSARSAGALVISVAPVFASRWLIWRLPAFYAACPGIRVRVDATLDLVNPSAGEADLCIRVGKGDWPGVTVEPFLDQVIFPVATAAVATTLRTPADLSTATIIHETSPGFGWRDWLEPEGFGDLTLGGGPEFSGTELCVDAAIAGVGVFLAFETVVADALAAGRLVAPFPGRHRTGNGYWIVTARGRRPTQAARTFIRWLKSEIAAAGLGKI